MTSTSAVTVRPVSRAVALASVVALLALTAVAYVWDLASSGYANSFYSAAAQAGSQDWAAWFFGSLDSSNAITVDKPPASLWLMGLSVRIFGLSPWSILVPQALLGVATVGVVVALVRRVLTRDGVVTTTAHVAAILAGLVVATTPVAALMFRFNNPDALLLFLMTLAAWMVVRALNSTRPWWLMAAGVVIGVAFLTKMLQALLILPAFVVAYVLFSTLPLGRRVLYLLGACAAMVMAGGWWIAIVDLMPASWRPWIGGSQTNSALELTLGYNGLGRITGDEVGSVGGGGPFSDGVGLLRMFTDVSGGMVSWMIPAALLLTVVALVLRGRASRTDLRRATLIMTSLWLIVTMTVFSFMGGIYHDYYTVALAAPIGVLIGLGVAEAWEQRTRWVSRVGLALASAATVVWAVVLLGQAGGVYGTLRWPLVAAAVLTTVAFLVPRLPRRLVQAAAVTAVLAALTGPVAYSAQTIATPHQGSIVTAGPVSGRGPGGAPGVRDGQRPDGGTGMAPPAGGPPGDGTPPRRGGSGQPDPGTPPGPNDGTRPDPGTPLGRNDGTQPDGGGPGGMGGLLNGASVSDEVKDLLSGGASNHRWVAAAVGAQNAASYQLATELPVMAVGGFNGSDPSPTLAQFKEYVAAGDIHWFIGGEMGGRQNGGSQAASEIAAWVTENFTATTVGNTTFHDLTQPS